MAVLKALAAGLLLALTAQAAQAAAPAKVQVGDGRTFPESMSATAGGTLYAGSLTMGVIYRAKPGADKATPFIPKPASGPASIHGVYVDAAHCLLWACYADANPGAPNALASEVKAFALASGKPKGSYTLGPASMCNDITTTRNGTAYVTDTLGGRVLRLKPAGKALEPWLKDPRLAGADGIAAASSRVIYVNSVTANKLYRVDVKADGSAGALTEITLSRPVQGGDGMRFGRHGVLYLAENHGNQADALAIKGDEATVTTVATGVDGPTAVQPVGSTLWVLEDKATKRSDPNEKGPFFMFPFAIKD